MHLGPGVLNVAGGVTKPTQDSVHGQWNTPIRHLFFLLDRYDLQIRIPSSWSRHSCLSLPLPATVSFNWTRAESGGRDTAGYSRKELWKISRYYHIFWFTKSCKIQATFLPDLHARQPDDPTPTTQRMQLCLVFYTSVNINQSDARGMPTANSRGTPCWLGFPY